MQKQPKGFIPISVVDDFEPLIDLSHDGEKLLRLFLGNMRDLSFSIMLGTKTIGLDFFVVSAIASASVGSLSRESVTLMVGILEAFCAKDTRRIATAVVAVVN